MCECILNGDVLEEFTPRLTPEQTEFVSDTSFIKVFMDSVMKYTNNLSIDDPQDLEKAKVLRQYIQHGTTLVDQFVTGYNLKED